MPVHPRLRGEHPAMGSAGCSASGSSPPTRGTLLAPPAQKGGDRFIPAYAGNTTPGLNWMKMKLVHPRLRGEHMIGTALGNQGIGSSPPTRGTPGNHRGLWVLGRFIPAYAGNTSHRRAFAAGSPVHPRLRGEHSELPEMLMDWLGSSPPTRGTLFL